MKRQQIQVRTRMQRADEAARRSHSLETSEVQAGYQVVRIGGICRAIVLLLAIVPLLFAFIVAFLVVLASERVKESGSSAEIVGRFVGFRVDA
ncbi:MAG: hypothetical protein ACRETB_10110 [Steroidobacteraceae bacterium]